MLVDDENKSLPINMMVSVIQRCVTSCVRQIFQIKFILGFLLTEKWNSKKNQNVNELVVISFAFLCSECVNDFRHWDLERYWSIKFYIYEIHKFKLL